MKSKVTDKISIQESRLLVPPGKSKRLAALRQQSCIQESETANAETQEAVLPVELSKETAKALSEARACIQRQIEHIKRRYPPGRQNKLFTIRYGEFERIKRKNIKEIFVLLDLDADLKNFDLIAHLDYDGNESGAGKAWEKRF